jgi:hypothetical protein
MGDRRLGTLGQPLVSGNGFQLPLLVAAELEEIDAADFGRLAEAVEDLADARLPVRRAEEPLGGEPDSGEDGIAPPQSPLEAAETLLRVL